MSESAEVASASLNAQASVDFAAFEAAENAKAMGQEPPAAEPKPVADPHADEHDEPAAAVVEATPVVAVEPVAKVSKRQQHINDLERKATESAQKAEQLAARLAAIEAKAVPATESVKPEPAAPVVDPKDPEPVEADFETYPEFIRASARWTVRQDKREAEATKLASDAKAAKDTRETYQRESLEAWATRRDAYAATNPTEFADVLPFLGHLQTGTPIGDAIVESDVGMQMARYLKSHPDEFARISQLSPNSALRALGKIEALYETTHASAPAQPAAKTQTTAPAPPPTLAARSASPADPVAAAVANGDYLAFEAEENRRAVAASR